MKYAFAISALAAVVSAGGDKYSYDTYSANPPVYSTTPAAVVYSTYAPIYNTYSANPPVYTTPAAVYSTSPEATYSTECEESTSPAAEVYSTYVAPSEVYATYEVYTTPAASYETVPEYVYTTFVYTTSCPTPSVVEYVTEVPVETPYAYSVINYVSGTPVATVPAATYAATYVHGTAAPIATYTPVSPPIAVGAASTLGMSAAAGIFALVAALL